MKNKAKLFGIYLPIYLLLVPTAVILRTIACIKDYEGWYFADKLFSTLSATVLILSVIFFLTSIWTMRKDVRLIPSFSSPAHFVPGGIVSVALAFVGIELFSVAARRFSTLDRQDSNFIYSTIMAFLAFAAAILAFVSIAYFINSSVNPKRRSIRHSDFAILTTVFFCIYVAIMYFDTTIPINSPVRTTDQMAMLASTLFFLYEARLSLGREKWRQYVAYGMTASAITAYSSIPSLAYYFVNSKPLTSSISLGNLPLYDSILIFSLFIFITCKLFLTGKLIPNKTSAIVEKIIEAADARIAELTHVEEVKDEMPDEAEVAENEQELTDDEPIYIEQESFFTDEALIAEDITKEDDNA